jgi:hypothetical protein
MDQNVLLKSPPAHLMLMNHHVFKLQQQHCVCGNHQEQQHANPLQ